MIAFIEENNDKKQLVIAKIVGDMNQIIEKINNSDMHYEENDKEWVEHYLFQGMISDNSAKFGDKMYCNVRDILRKTDIDDNLKKLNSIFESTNFKDYLYLFVPRLLILYLEVMPFIKIKEIGRCDYDIIKGSLPSSHIYKFSSDKYEQFIESARINSLMFEIMRKRLRDFNYDEENVENILNSDLDDTAIMAYPKNYGIGAKVNLKRKNAETGAKILID